MTWDLFKTLISPMIRIWASVFEARCAALLDGLPYFIFGEEFGTADAGLLVSDRSDLNDLHGSSRTFEALYGHESNRRRVITLDFKTTSVIKHKGKINRVIKITKYQRSTCDAFIIQDVSMPSWVALVPTYYLRPEDKSSTFELYLQNETIMWGRGEWAEDGFGPEWSVFVMPWSYLSIAVESMYGFALNFDNKWHNPYNGVVFKNHPKMETRSIGLLRPSEKSTGQDHKVFVAIRDAFKACNSRYIIERFWIRPLSGDFKIVDSEGQSQARIEYKSQMCNLDDSRHHLKHQARFPKPLGERKDENLPYFDITTGWDMLLTRPEKSSDALLFWRDELPDEWFHDSKSKWLHFHTDSNDRLFTDRVIPLAKGYEKLVRRFEDVMSKRSTWMVPARDIAIAPGEKDRDMRLPEIGVDAEDKGSLTGLSLSLESNTVVEDARTDDEDDSEQGSKKRKKIGEWDRRGFEHTQATMIMDQCEGRGFGLIYPTGGHPRGSHIFMPYQWTQKERRQYRELGKTPLAFTEIAVETPMVVLNLAPVDIFDTLVPYDRNQANFLHVTHASKDSLYLLDVQRYWYFGKKPGISGNARYLVPSPRLRTDELIDMNNKRVTKTLKSNEARKLPLMKEELLDAYKVCKTDLVLKLTEFFGGEDEVLIGSTMVNSDEYLTDKRLLMQDWVENKETKYWKNINAK